VDPSGVIEAVSNGLSHVPPVIIATVLLAGPTAIWLAARFLSPPELNKRIEPEVTSPLWVCVSCRSMNDEWLKRCYSCHAARPADAAVLTPDVAVSADAGDTALGPDVGIAVGPGRQVESAPAASWLEDVVGEALSRSGLQHPADEAPGWGGQTAAEPAAMLSQLPDDARAASVGPAAAMGPVPVAAGQERDSPLEPARPERRIKVPASPTPSRRREETGEPEAPLVVAVVRSPEGPEPSAEPAAPTATRRTRRRDPAGRIAAELARLPRARGVAAVVVEAPQSEIYVQFVRVGETIIGEAVGETNLSQLSAYRMGARMRARLPQLGWSPPADQASNAGNWTRTWPRSGWDPADVERLVIETFDEAYGIEAAGLTAFTDAGSASG
jgi:hypothetical protein